MKPQKVLPIPDRPVVHNRTRCPDDVLIAVIEAAAQEVGVDARIVVKTTMNRSRDCAYGKAYKMSVYYWESGRFGSESYQRHMRRVSGGWVEAHMPRLHPADDPILSAGEFFYLMVHELQHIRDFQLLKAGVPMPFRSDMRWADRPQEQRACGMVNHVKSTGPSPASQDAILNLAVWYDENRGRP